MVRLRSSGINVLKHVTFPTGGAVCAIRKFSSVHLTREGFLPVRHLVRCSYGSVMNMDRCSTGGLGTRGVARRVRYMCGNVYPVRAKRRLSFRLPGGCTGVILYVTHLSPRGGDSLFVTITRLLPRCTFM